MMLVMSHTNTDVYVVKQMFLLYKLLLLCFKQLLCCVYTYNADMMSMLRTGLEYQEVKNIS